MANKEKVIKGLEHEIARTNLTDLEWLDCVEVGLLRDALALLKEQEPATVEPKRIELADETKAWLDKMDAIDALGNIADICIDWDGYRTANGLGGLINEIWAYARYCADRLNKTLGAVEPVPSVDNDGDWLCGNCYQRVAGKEELDASWFVPIKFNFCPMCGRRVKWE